MVISSARESVRWGSETGSSIVSGCGVFNGRFSVFTAHPWRALWLASLCALVCVKGGSDEDSQATLPKITRTDHRCTVCLKLILQWHGLKGAEQELGKACDHVKPLGLACPC